MPNWRLGSDYDFTNNLSSSGWAWEYLRRNFDYRRDIEALEVLVRDLSESYANVLQYPPRQITDVRAFHFDPPLLTGESIEEWRSRCIREMRQPSQLPVWHWIARRWRIKSILWSPHNNEPPEFIVYRNYPWLIKDYENIGNYYYGPDDGYELSGNYAVLVFDLSQSILRQIQEAKSLLHSFRAEKNIRTGRSYTNRAKNPTYLRVLDAHAEGISEDVIGQSNMYMHLSDSAADNYNRRRRIRDNLEQALNLTRNYHDLLKEED